MDYTVCPECESHFQAKSSQHRFCSTGCRVGFYNHGKKYLRGFGKTKCYTCRRLFSKNSVNQKYCSSDCRIAKIGYVKSSLGNSECLWCQSTFPKAQHNQKYCSKECGFLFRKANGSEPLDLRKCPNCEIEFDPGFPHQVYCGERCKRESRRTISYYTIFGRDRFNCIYCGRSPLRSMDIELVLVHVRPWRSSKDSTASNVATCCATCKSERQKNPIDDCDEVIAVIAERNTAFCISPTARVNMVS